MTMEKKQRRWMTKLPQYWKMVELLREKPDIGQGSLRRGRLELDEFWLNLAEQCNLMGPPLKKPDLWKRTWYDYRNNMRIKYEKCKRNNTMHFLTNLDKEVIKISNFEKEERVEDDHDVEIVQPAAPPTNRNSVDIEILSDGEIVKDEYYLYNTDDYNDIPATVPSNQLNNEQTKDYHSDSPPEKRPRICEQSRDDRFSTASAHFNEAEGEEDQEGSDIKLLQQQIDIQKNLYKETKEFQIRTSDTLQDISLTLNSIRGTVETIEGLNELRLKEYERHNRKIEELLQKLAARK